MKKFQLLIAAAAMLLAVDASAQLSAGIHYGVVGGFTSTNTKLKEFDAKNVSLYHAGATVKFNIGAGFAVQPSLIYQVKGTDLKTATASAEAAIKALDAKVGYLELPVQLQWGPDLMALRPYAFFEPFIGYGVNFKAESGLNLEGIPAMTDIDIEQIKNDWKKAAISRLEYGFGVGGGIEVASHIQISAQWFMNLGGLADEKGDIDASAIAHTVKENLSKKNFQGFKISLAVLF